MELTRRGFLGGTLGASLAVMIGCGDDGAADGRGDEGNDGANNGANNGTNNGPANNGPANNGANNGPANNGPANNGPANNGPANNGPANNGQTDCHDAFVGGTYLTLMPFLGEYDGRFETQTGAGHDGRLLTDLKRIQPGLRTIPNDAFYLRTFYPDRLDPQAPWAIRMHGLVTEEVSLSLDDLAPLVEPQGTHVLECSGNTYHGSFGLMSAADWSGAPLIDVLQRADIRPEATRVLVSGYDEHTHVSTHSTPSASWVFTFEEIEQAGGFLATEMNGEPLSPDHGRPVRLYMPNWYGCCNIKWVNEIKLVDDSEPSTAQMIEFASRTHQNGEPRLAASFQPATMDQAAMPVRIEKWRVDGRILYRLIGIMWGGYESTDALQIQLGEGRFWEDVDVCPAQSDNAGWTIWQHAWTAPETGAHAVRLRVNDPAVRTRRLDSGHYTRTVQIDEV